MTLRYYERNIQESTLIELFNSEDYWLGITSDWDGGIFSKKHRAKRKAYYKRIANRVRCMNMNPVRLLDVGYRGEGNMLEVGCGVGYIVKALIEMGIDARGIDVSKWAVKHAVTPKVQMANILNLPFGDKQFSFVFSHDVLEHIPIADLPRAISELERVGKRNYHIISCGSLPNDRDITHVTMHQLRWWRNRLPESWVLEMKQ